ncbi:MAG: helix-hairpin-helix domain-containing protein [Hydrococcus sp. C42_A2020_068]|nr:helix-hairpin-helix domain-containing protein [Hydrococcus sp. C42_A2020_068]
MKLPTSLVAVKKISSSVARSSFPAEKIEKAAHLILNVEGTINPIILRRTSLESFEVVDGHFEYYAAVRAREISPLKGEMIQAIILESENEKALLDQVDLLRKDSNPKPLPDGNNSDLDFRFANLERVFQSQFEELRKDIRNLKQSIDEVASKVQNSGFSGELIDEIVNKVVKAVPLKGSSSRSKKKSIDELKQKPLDLNLASENELRTVPGIGPKIASRIVERRKTKGNFTSVEELSEIKGISKNMIDKNQWRECFVIRDSST